MIQQAGDRAIEAGTTLAKVLAIAAEIRKTSEIPLLLFTYLNPALRYGFERWRATPKPPESTAACLPTSAWKRPATT